MAVNSCRVLRNVALRIDERMKDSPGQRLMNDFHHADLHHPVPFGRTEAGRLGVKYNFTHDGLDAPRSLPRPALWLSAADLVV
jgi:hypothetical protein